VPKKRPTGEWADFAKALGTRIQRLRLARGLSQEQVAYASDLSRYTFQKFEKGESMPGTPANPSLRNIMAIAQTLGVGLDELLPSPWPDLRPGRASR
jgi:transcriptional regulator with XRE-family HTH domain